MSTIRDVARIAAVSTATVSRVINTPEKVSIET
ncbi:MAG: LacI family DNA-binding transcriptional regulator, partial [Desulfobacterales bacterium]